MYHYEKILENFFLHATILNTTNTSHEHNVIHCSLFSEMPLCELVFESLLLNISEWKSSPGKSIAYSSSSNIGFVIFVTINSGSAAFLESPNDHYKMRFNVLLHVADSFYCCMCFCDDVNFFPTYCFIFACRCFLEFFDNIIFEGLSCWNETSRDWNLLAQSGGILIMRVFWGWNIFLQISVCGSCAPLCKEFSHLI